MKILHLLVLAITGISLCPFVLMPINPVQSELSNVTITGKVYNDTNNNGVQNVGELGIPGARVIAIDRANPAAILYATTDANGAYLFDNITIGDSLLIQVAPTLQDHFPSTGRHLYYYVTVIPGQNLVDFPLLPTNSNTGTLTTNNNDEIRWLNAGYPTNGTAVLQIEDPDMNLNPMAIDTFDTSVWSDSDLGGTRITMTETGKSTGIFQSTVYLSTKFQSSGNRLHVNEGDTLTGEFIDRTLPPPYTIADQLGLVSTAFVGSTGPPMERAPASNPRIIDSFGNAVSGLVKVGQQIQIAAELTNGQDRDQPFAYIVQIQDAKGVNIFLSWISGTLTSGQKFNPEQSWMPQTSGTYTAQIFVWQSIDNPNALSPPLSTIINVASQQSIQPSSATHPIPTSCHAVNNDTLPDPKCTPGVIDYTVTQDNINSTICVAGYTTTVRPPVSYMQPLKFKLMDAYGFTDSPSNYELDHLISLELGGSPDNVKNLWPEPHYTSPSPYTKDGFENYLHNQVCSGKIDLKTAQNEIATDWLKYWQVAKN